MGSSITVLVPDSSLGAGEALSILCLSEPSENPSLAGGSGIMEEEGAGEMCLLRAKSNCADQGNFYSCISLSSPCATSQWGGEWGFLIQRNPGLRDPSTKSLQYVFACWPGWPKAGDGDSGRPRSLSPCSRSPRPPGRGSCQRALLQGWSLGAVLEKAFPGHSPEGQTKGQVLEKGPRLSGKEEMPRGPGCFHLGTWWPQMGGFG